VQNLTQNFFGHFFLTHDDLSTSSVHQSIRKEYAVLEKY